MFGAAGCPRSGDERFPVSKDLVVGLSVTVTGKDAVLHDPSRLMTRKTAPSISGAARVGALLTADPGSWSEAGDHFREVGERLLEDVFAVVVVRAKQFELVAGLEEDPAVGHGQPPLLVRRVQRST